MGDQLTIRVPDELYQRLARLAERRGVRKSDIAREALGEYLTSAERLSDPRPIEKVADLIGTLESGEPDLGEKHREHLIERLTRDDA